MGQTGKLVLWQQHAYIAATLESRNDKEEVGKFTFFLILDSFPQWEIGFGR